MITDTTGNFKIDYFKPNCGHDNCVSRGWRCNSCKKNPLKDYYEPDYEPYTYIQTTPNWTPTYTIQCDGNNITTSKTALNNNPCDTCCNFE